MERNPIIEKQVKGLLNRISVNNFESIAVSISSLYQSNSRRTTTEILLKLIVDSISKQGNLLDSFILVFAALTSALCHIIGSEFSGMMIQKLVELLDVKMKQLRSGNLKELPDEDDEVCPSRVVVNVITFISFLYNLQIIAYKIIGDILKESIKHLEEIDTEVILKLIRNCAIQFKKEDPSTVAEIISLLDSRLVSVQADTTTTRFRYMIECIYDLKSNKQKALSLHHGELEVVKKLIRSMLRKGLGEKFEPLRIGLDDIRKIDSKGKWWIVGGIWNPDVVNDLQNQDPIPAASLVDRITLMAKSQRMNTDVRKAVFKALLSSVDYLDAFNRLVRLKLSSKQEREIILVILHCVSRVLLLIITTSYPCRK